MISKFISFFSSTQGTWNERFQNLLESPIKVSAITNCGKKDSLNVSIIQTPKDCQKRAQLLQTLIDEFVEEARGNVETIIKELHLPLERKTILPMSDRAGFMGGAKYIHVRMFGCFFSSSSSPLEVTPCGLEWIVLQVCNGSPQLLWW